MDHQIIDSGFGLRLRPVRLEDARFILDLRCDPSLNQFINETLDDLEMQKDWMRRYFQKTDDYYFLMEAEKTGRPVGTLALYDIAPDLSHAEQGRWIIAPGVMAAAAASQYLIYRIAFERLKIGKVLSCTVAENKRVLSIHDRIGATRVGIKKDATVIRGVSRDHVLHQVDREQWRGLEPKLRKMAEEASAFWE